MRHLIFADRDDLSMDDHDVDRLQERIPEQAEVRHVALGHIPEALLVRRHALQPSERGDHPEEQREFRDLRQLGLAVQDGPFGIDPGSEQVQHETFDERGKLVDPVVVRRQHVPVGYEVEALVSLVLQADGVADVPGPVSDVQGSRRTEPGEDARSFGDCAHDGAMIAPVPSAPGSRPLGTALLELQEELAMHARGRIAQGAGQGRQESDRERTEDEQDHEHDER